MNIDVRQQIKEYLAKESITMKELVDILNKNKPENEQTTPASLSNKLARGTIKYIEIIEIAQALGYYITWQKPNKLEYSSSKVIEPITGNWANSVKETATGMLVGGATGGFFGSIVGGALGFTLGKSGVITGLKDENNKNIITGDDVTENAKEFEKENGYNPIPTDEELHEMAKMQERLNLELDIETNVILILDEIVLSCNQILKEKYKNDIENYIKYAMDEFTLGFKLLPAYRLVCNILTEQSNSDSIEILRFLTKLRNLYAHGGLLDLNDNELKQLYDATNQYKNLLNNNKKD